jgi:hypothetical protein
MAAAEHLRDGARMRHGFWLQCDLQAACEYRYALAK